MAQSHHRVTQVVSGLPRAFDGSHAAIIEWQVVRTAPTEMAAVLAAWRSAERALGDHIEDGPERARLKLQINRLRAKYHHLFEAAVATVHANEYAKP